MLAAVALGACSAGAPLPTVLYLAATANPDQHLDAELREYFRTRLTLLQEGFQHMHPGTAFQLGLYPENDFIAAMTRRSRAGLEPDLLYINGDTALQMLQAGLVDPFPADSTLLQHFDPEMLARLRSPDGRLAGLPVLVQTQLSCYDRRRLPQPPSTLAALVQSSAAGHGVGLPLDPFNLLWTAGSLGALPALEQALRGQALSPEDRKSLERWLAWLQNANAKGWVSVYASQPEADADLIAGKLSWIPCRSTSLTSLRRQLGSRLGVAPLPDGPAGPASAVNRLRVVALGRHSSASARERALAFSHFFVNPLTQRKLATESSTVLPANRFVRLPLQSSPQLQTMQIAARQGLQANALMALLHANGTRLQRLQTLITALVFTEITPAAAADQLLRMAQEKR